MPEPVVTRRPPPAEHDLACRLVSGHDLSGAMVAADGKLAVVIGPILTAAFLRAGPVDHVVVHVAQVLLGAGVPLLGSDRAASAQPVTVAVFPAGAITNLVYQPRVRVSHADLIGSGGGRSIQPTAARLGLPIRNVLRPCVSGGRWNAPPLAAGSVAQAKRQVGGLGAALIADDASVPKKGSDSVGAAPQNASISGQNANCPRAGTRGQGGRRPLRRSLNWRTRIEVQRRPRIIKAEAAGRKAGTSTARSRTPSGNIQIPRNGRNETSPPSIRRAAKGSRRTHPPSPRSSRSGLRSTGMRRSITAN